jgi:uncharacterized protein (TIGR02118 family)
MVKLILMVHRKPGLTPAQFKAHYESTHAPLALASFTGVTRYTRNYLQAFPNQPAPPYDCVTELCFADQASLQASMAWTRSEAGQILARDEARFMDRAAMAAFISEEISSVVPSPTDSSA